MARRHSYAVGTRELLAKLRDPDISRQEQLQTVESLKESYEADIGKWGYRRQWEKALDLFRDMEQNGVPHESSCYTAMIRACGEKVKEWKLALAILNELQDSNLDPQVESYNWAMTSCAKGSAWDAALKIMQEMRGRNIRFDEGTLVAGFIAMGGGGLWEEALVLLGEMEELEIEPDELAFNLVFQACENADEEDWMEWVEDEAASLGFEISV